MRIVLTRLQKKKIQQYISKVHRPGSIRQEELLTFTEVSVSNEAKGKIKFLTEVGFVKVYQGAHGSTFVHEICLEEYFLNLPPKENDLKKKYKTLKDVLSFDE